MVRERTVGLLLIGLLCSAAGCDGLSKEQRREIAKIEQHIRDHPEAIDAADQPGGLTALHVAMLNDYMELARWLLERGANPNAPDGKGEAPLHAAAIFDRKAGCPMTRQLLALGIPAEGDDPVGAEAAGGDHRAKTDRAVSDDGDHTAGSDTGAHGRMVARTHDVRKRHQ